MTSSSWAALTSDTARTYARLLDALGTLAEAGRVTPCQRDPHPFTGEVGKPERDLATGLCRTRCPVVDLCRDYAERAGESHHVWGGQNRHSMDLRRPADVSGSES